MKKTKSVYKRMFNNRKLFLLGFGVLYITEMRRVKNLSRTSELRIKSKGLAEVWYKLFKKHDLISKNNKGIHVRNGIYTFSCTSKSLYELIEGVKKLPEKNFDCLIRKRIGNITYSGYNTINKNRIKILKTLNKNSFTTNELARRINYNSGTAFKNHLDLLQKISLIKRNKIGKQKVTNSLTKKGKIFINKFVSEVDNVPNYSLYDECFKNKQLASDLMLIISELEMGGIMERQPYLEMNSYDFVKFVFDVCRKWKWTNQKDISKRLIPGYKSTYLFRLNPNGIKEIYNLSGPCADINKDKEFLHIFSLRNLGVHGRIGKTKENILKLIRNNLNTSKQIAFELNIGVQNIQKQLSNFVKEGILIREKVGTGYSYKIK
jgi:predicted transcriptional regulator